MISILDQSVQAYFNGQCMKVSHITLLTTWCGRGLVWAGPTALAPVPPAAAAAVAAAAVRRKAGALRSAQARRRRGESVVWDCEATWRASGLLGVTLRPPQPRCPLWGRQRLGLGTQSWKSWLPPSRKSAEAQKVKMYWLVFCHFDQLQFGL